VRTWRRAHRPQPALRAGFCHDGAASLSAILGQPRLWLASTAASRLLPGERCPPIVHELGNIVRQSGAATLSASRAGAMRAVLDPDEAVSAKASPLLSGSVVNFGQSNNRKVNRTRGPRFRRTQSYHNGSPMRAEMAATGGGAPRGRGRRIDHGEAEAALRYPTQQQLGRGGANRHHRLPERRARGAPLGSFVVLYCARPVRRRECSWLRRADLTGESAIGTG
jgi:hypothetical protein